ncbi:16S rRNA (cytidine(1402)-2'-O)-methyltransferase [Marichromatium gracile]|uniref:Ribosomal RNA small subunit methyltransferase I n=1 Tax=Marichromatium gracile TaxID=1048 RepID=A0A4R4AGV6_MARGR|nr:16S rRNA (cytidine(1402)-2'-O)-methyltransferase [Marichromatium gracile]MBK1709299.1 16S rRNA (cytidine(1402)-2'-O)-methyltransferase [Marichromatium gracile]TCW38194.1 16S rRNA (cytidine1402-2'-O)-methyltransferase [Marichromatium gracile]
MERGRGVLYVVATPIGNLADISERARNTLNAVDLIAAEDTRESGRLLAHLGISARLVSCHEHNAEGCCARVLEALGEGRDVALVSDAGTPLVSDPGYELVNAARAADFTVVPVPGPSALICALSAAGLPSDRFLFLGFPPRGQSQRVALFESLLAEPGTLILYESGKRAVATLRDLAAVLGERRAVVGRELTKRFETFLSATPAALAERLEADAEQRLGELVILVEGQRGEAAPDRAEQERVLRILAEALPLRRAAALAAQITGAKTNALYRLGVELELGGKG